MAKKKTTRKNAKKTDKADASLEPEGDCCEEDTRSAAQESAKGVMLALLDETRSKNVEAALIDIADALRMLKSFPKKLSKKKLLALSESDVCTFVSHSSDVQKVLTAAARRFQYATEMITLAAHAEELDLSNPKIKI
jgi:hypothetical protein